jgi:hypothetical protein
MTEPKKRGWARMRELGQEQAEQRREITEALLSGLGSASALERAHAGCVAFWQVRAEYQESIGRDSTEARTKLYQALKAFGVKPDKAAPKAAPTNIDDIYAEMTAQSEARS